MSIRYVYDRGDGTVIDKSKSLDRLRQYCSVPFHENGEHIARLLNQALDSVPYPQFCPQPEICAGKSNCPRDPCCCD